MTEVLVIGAGITGCFTAFHLARQGIPAILVDKEDVGAQASGNNPGGLNPLHGPGLPGKLSELAWQSFQLHLEHQQDLVQWGGEDARLRRVRRIELAWNDVETMELQASLVTHREAQGFAARWIEAHDLLAMESRLCPEITGGLWTEGNGMVDSHAYTRAVSQAAQHLGVTLIRGSVQGICSDDSIITAACVNGTAIPCSAIVFATGAQISGPSEWLGINLPVEPVKGQLLLAEHDGPSMDQHITHGAIGIYHINGNQVWLGGTQEREGFNTQPTPEGRESIIREVSRLVPTLTKANILDHVAALRPVTPDGLPILGVAPSWENAYLATGAGTKGMLLGSGMGKAVAGLIAQQKPDIDLSPFDPGRFQSLIHPTVNPLAHHAH